MDARLAWALLYSVGAAIAAAPAQNNSQDQTTQLTVPAGSPLRLYLTKRIPKRPNAPVEAKVLEPVYAFDREVIPAGSQVLGHVSSVQPVSKWVRTRSVLAGDFTPLRSAKVQFTEAVLPNGSKVQLHTAESAPLNSLVPLKPPKPPKNRKQPAPTQPGGVLGSAKQTAKDQVNAQINRVMSVPNLVRGPDKMERLTDYQLAKLPYHPQYVRSRTRFDAELSEPLNFGPGTVTQESLALLGTPPAAGSVVHARLLTPLDSLHSTKGEKVEAALIAPLFGDGHKLLLPEGTRLEGSVVVARRAGWFHRGGRLLFNFQKVELPPEVGLLKREAPTGAPSLTQAPHVEEAALQFKTRANLAAAEGTGATVKVDDEGTVKATESKTRFFDTALALLVSQRSGDTDAGRNHAGTAESANVGGRTAGGAIGLGLLGTGLAQISPNVGAALGYYGLAWSVFATLVARGAEVEFGRNAALDIGFSNRPPSGPNNLKTEVSKVAAK